LSIGRLLNNCGNDNVNPALLRQADVDSNQMGERAGACFAVNGLVGEAAGKKVGRAQSGSPGLLTLTAPAPF